MSRHGQEAEEDLGDPLQLLLENKVQSVEFSGGQVIVDAARAGRIYLPGSFNPLHDGHKCVNCEDYSAHRLGHVILPELSKLGTLLSPCDGTAVRCGRVCVLGSPLP